MKLIKVLTQTVLSLAFTLTALPGLAADYPAPKEGNWNRKVPDTYKEVVRRFH
jgi:hypothetical protein